MNIKSNEISNACVFGMLCLNPVLFSLSKNDLIPRSGIEGIYILCAVLLSIQFKGRILISALIISIILIRLGITGSFEITTYDLACLPLLLFYSSFSLSLLRLRIALIFLILFEFFYGVWAFASGDFVDFFRIGGAFPGSMHYGFSTAGLAIALFLTKIPYKLILFLPLLISSLLSGSRSALLCVVALNILVAVENVGLKKVMLTVVFLLLTVLLLGNDLRALNYVEGSDDVRLSGYISWMMRQDIISLLFGQGRYYVGSIGVVNNGENSLVTESSVLTYIEGYGIFTGMAILAAPYIKYYKSLNLIIFLYISLVYFILSILGPFLETPSILFVNAILIISALKTRQLINLK